MIANDSQPATAAQPTTHRLDRAIATIANVSRALATTTNGVEPLAQALVQVAAQHFAAEWAVLIVNRRVFRYWVAHRGTAGLVTHAEDDLPPDLHDATRKALDLQQLVHLESKDGPTILAAPMWVSEEARGALAVVPESGFEVDDREIMVLQTLANQAAVAIDNALLYEEAQRQRRELERKNRELEQADRWLQVARQNEIVNEERSRIARELHDSVAQHLLSIGMNLEWCRAQLTPDSPVHERVSVAKELARNAVDRIRSAIFELSSMGGRDVDLATALRDLAHEFSHATRLPVKLRVLGESRRVPEAAEHALYQIAQESLFNAFKHARARQINMTLRFTGDALILTIADDGIGISETAMSRRGERGHYGLRNMRARARELGGTFTIRPRDGGGTEARVRIPMINDQ
jgi:signal transduction histidine kinase